MRFERGAAVDALIARLPRIPTVRRVASLARRVGAAMGFRPINGPLPAEAGPLHLIDDPIAAPTRLADGSHGGLPDSEEG